MSERVHVFDVGPQVVCDNCGADWTGRPESGGFLFVTKAICPTCAPVYERDIVRYGETRHIRQRCPEGLSFAQWVLQLRAGDNTVIVRTVDRASDLRKRPRSQ